MQCNNNNNNGTATAALNTVEKDNNHVKALIFGPSPSLLGSADWSAVKWHT